MPAPDACPDPTDFTRVPCCRPRPQAHTTGRTAAPKIGSGRASGLSPGVPFSHKAGSSPSTAGKRVSLSCRRCSAGRRTRAIGARRTTRAGRPGHHGPPEGSRADCLAPSGCRTLFSVRCSGGLRCASTSGYSPIAGARAPNCVGAASAAPRIREGRSASGLRPEVRKPASAFPFSHEAGSFPSSAGRRAGMMGADCSTRAGGPGYGGPLRDCRFWQGRSAQPPVARP